MDMLFKIRHILLELLFELSGVPKPNQREIALDMACREIAKLLKESKNGP